MGTPLKREKRAYRKRKHLKSGLSRPTLPGLVTVGGLLLPAHVQEALSSDDDRASINLKQSDQELEEEEMEGPFSFKRKAEERIRASGMAGGDLAGEDVLSWIVFPGEEEAMTW